jgi:hypothetical protein
MANWDTRSDLAAEAVAGLNGHSHQWGNYLHTASVLIRKSEQHHCKLCSGCGQLMCEETKQPRRATMLRPGYHFDNHKLLVDQLYTILDKAAVEYDEDADVVSDFIEYMKDWANRREDRGGAGT